MFEYHCWAALPDFGDREAEMLLSEELRTRIDALEDGARESFNFTNLNARMVAASGLRNHSQPFVLDIFEWIAAEWPGSYGLMYVASEFPDEDGKWRWHVLKIGDCKTEHLEDRYFGTR
ncbi:Imm7 family immunity protein [Longimicrobium sp.]|jgi:hypothetical protein|uniref:Imm7 family immunity protein n=1 Tax=Longimicrobium sp. TaxID=2029185 RepID=UPI002ED87C95